MDLYGYPMLLTFTRNQEVTTLFISSEVVGTSLKVTIEKVTSLYSNQPISLLLETISGPLCSRVPSSNVDEKADSNPIESICTPPHSLFRLCRAVRVLMILKWEWIGLLKTLWLTLSTSLWLSRSLIGSSLFSTRLLDWTCCLPVKRYRSISRLMICLSK